jgi:hypothetical protein
MTTKRTKRIPKLENCNGSGRVYLCGRYHYIGSYGAPETTSTYARMIAEWSANNYVVPVARDEVTITELCRDYWLFSKGHYVRPDGSPTQTLHGVKEALKLLKSLYGSMKASEFGPLALRALRDKWIAKGLTRRTCTYLGVLSL